MRLIHKATGKEVQVGDTVRTHRGQKATVVFFVEPHKPEAEGRITVQEEDFAWQNTYYVSVFGCEWIEREDRKPE